MNMVCMFLAVLLSHMLLAAGACVSYAAEGDLVLKVALDSEIIVSGGAVSGEFSVVNESGEPVVLGGANGDVFARQMFAIQGPAGRIVHFPHFGPMADYVHGGPMERSTILPGSRLRGLIYLQGIFDDNCRCSVYPFREPGIYQLAVSLIVYSENGRPIGLSASPVRIVVGDGGEGIEEFLDAIGGRRFDYPFTSVSQEFIAYFNSTAENSPYREEAARLIAYQYGAGMNRILANQEFSSGRPAEDILDDISGGLVGRDTWAVHRWRLAALGLFNREFPDKSAIDVPAGFDVEEELSTMEAYGEFSME